MVRKKVIATFNWSGVLRVPMLGRWFDKGVDGFRVDMASSLVKNDPDKKEVSKLWNEMRAWKDKYYPETKK